MKRLNINKLSQNLEKISEINFAYLFGSCVDGFLRPGSDLDIAVYFSDNCTICFDLIAKVLKVIDESVPGVDCDLCRLNTASETLCFEALKGKQLFVRNEFLEKFAEFYSKVCREYEDYSFWVKKQLEYRGIQI